MCAESYKNGQLHLDIRRYSLSRYYNNGVSANLLLGQQKVLLLFQTVLLLQGQQKKTNIVMNHYLSAVPQAPLIQPNNSMLCNPLAIQPMCPPTYLIPQSNYFSENNGVQSGRQNSLLSQEYNKPFQTRIFQ
ncbi:hypothetical protein DdX_17731 [Ditylenchus destructor]|uniref:Uncharacterized protein n=1 Tax=Ditylenchus destructor TaxID=166010 RepID=A0AAD4MMI6_9BILA|nr:hypothetical protein DdX_17731 [Ditylenchus destructor]